MGDTVKIDFGKVERYVKDRGFGFISHTFAGSPSREVFFHIKNVRRTHPELAQALNTYNSHEPLYFWYEFETSEKGQQVRTILDPEKIGQNYSDNMFALKQTIGASWANADISISETTKKATFDLFPPNEARQLEARRKKDKSRRSDDSKESGKRGVLPTCRRVGRARIYTEQPSICIYYPK